MPDPFLDRVYDLKSTEATRDLYDDWADSYDDELAKNGYATPGRIAAALAGETVDPGAPVLDFGCGTGLSGAALHAAGFTVIDGADLSADMLRRAEAKGLYRRLWQVDPDAALPVRPGDYAAITATGVIGVGAAPAETYDTLLSALAPGGLFALSFNDHALAEPAFEGRLDASLADGRARLRFREHGAHLPGIGLGATVFVLERT